VNLAAGPAAGGDRCPEGRLSLPAFYETVKTLDQTVPVDAVLPGCPPEAERIWDALQSLMSGTLIPAGA